MTLSRKTDESPLDHHKRLVYGKLVDKTLADYDYSELSSYLYGKELTADEARKRMYGSRATLELIDQERHDAVADESILSEIDQKLIELRKEREKYYDQRRELNKIIRADGRQDHIFDCLEQAANRLCESTDTPFQKYNSAVISSDAPEAVLVLSDWHYGMVTDNVFNFYNTMVCEQRIAKVIAAAEQRLLLHKCRKLNVVVLGDLVHGGIHVSARVASEELVADQIMNASELLALSILELKQYVPEIEVHMTYGNHSRTIQNKNDNIHRDNMERLIPWWLTQRLKDIEGVTIADPSDTEFIILNTAGHDIVAAHGDLDSVKSSPKLIHSLFAKKWGKNVEYIILGDKHHAESFEELGITSMLCGSLCGADDYANGKRLYSSPSQLLLIVDENLGVDAEYRLKC